MCGFAKLGSLSLEVDGTEWAGVANMLQSLPARLNTLILDVFYTERVMDSDRLAKEDGERKA